MELINETKLKMIILFIKLQTMTLFTLNLSKLMIILMLKLVTWLSILSKIIPLLMRILLLFFLNWLSFYHIWLRIFNHSSNNLMRSFTILEIIVLILEWNLSRLKVVDTIIKVRKILIIIHENLGIIDLRSNKALWLLINLSRLKFCSTLI